MHTVNYFRVIDCEHDAEIEIKHKRKTTEVEKRSCKTLLVCKLNKKLKIANRTVTFKGA